MIYRKKNSLALFLVLLLVIPSFVLLAQNQGSQQSQPTVVATVNGENITAREVSQAAQLRQVYMMAMQQQLPQQFTQFLFSNENGQEFLQEYQKFVLDNLIEEKLKLQKIEELGINASEEEIEKSVDQQIQSTIQRSQKYESEEDLKEAYESQGDQSYKDAKDNLRDRARESILLKNLRNEITSNVEVSEEEAKSFYEENKDNYKEDEEVKPYDEVKDQVKNTMRRKKENEAWNNWLEKIREEADIEKNLEALGL